jgi:uncharacterized repeat protein (TIGR03803 family)
MTHASAAPKEKVLYSFCSLANCTDGAQPLAGLTNIKGALYGTTYVGGANGNGLGTLFSVDASTGAEKVLHSFGSDTDGSYPDAGLLDVKGTLYGTTPSGGAIGSGTLFSVDAGTGAEKVVYSFGRRGGEDGYDPQRAWLMSTAFCTARQAGAESTAMARRAQCSLSSRELTVPDEAAIRVCDEGTGVEVSCRRASAEDQAWSPSGLSRARASRPAFAEAERRRTAEDQFADSNNSRTIWRQVKC